MADPSSLDKSKADTAHLEPPVVDYSTNLSKRRNWSLGFVVVAALAAFPIRHALESLAALSSESALVISAVLGPGSVYTLFRWGFDRYGWRLRTQAFRFSNIPDLRGCWEGYVTISPTDSVREEEYPQLVNGRLSCFVVISQTWTRIALHFDTLSTHSVLTMATVNNINSTGAPGFRYEYLVTPKVESDLAKQGTGLLSGTAHLYWDPDDPACRELRGSYYNAPIESRFGEYVLFRTDKTSSSWRMEQAQAQPQK